MPRHPPCALHSLSHTPPTQPTHHHPHQKTQKPHTPPTPTTPTNRGRHKGRRRTRHQHNPTQKQRQRAHQAGGAHSTQLQRKFDARVHYPDLKQQPHTSTTASTSLQTPATGREPTTPSDHTPRKRGRVHRGQTGAEQPTPTPPLHGNPHGGMLRSGSPLAGVVVWV
jgi:hypothetical protein